jgi:hypothetical protein
MSPNLPVRVRTRGGDRTRRVDEPTDGVPATATDNPVAPVGSV